jgi:hypothetical protein
MSSQILTGAIFLKNQTGSLRYIELGQKTLHIRRAIALLLLSVLVPVYCTLRQIVLHCVFTDPGRCQFYLLAAYERKRSAVLWPRVMTGDKTRRGHYITNNHLIGAPLHEPREWRGPIHPHLYISYKTLHCLKTNSAAICTTKLEPKQAGDSTGIESSCISHHLAGNHYGPQWMHCNK